MCLTYTVPTIHSNDAMHTIPIIPVIHTTYTIHMQHNCHTYHTYNSKHTCHKYHTCHTSILSKHAIPDRPYTPYIPNIPYHIPTTPQGGRGTVPHPHHTTGGEGEDLNMGPIPCGGGGGGGRAWCIYTHTESTPPRILLRQAAPGRGQQLPQRLQRWALRVAEVLAQSGAAGGTDRSGVAQEPPEILGPLADGKIGWGRELLLIPSIIIETCC